LSINENDDDDDDDGDDDDDDVAVCGQHHCYSTTKKNSWESYTVEKGCKKIAYCRAHRESMPAVWTLPWNFCCDRSRCNAKLGQVIANARPIPQIRSQVIMRRSFNRLLGYTQAGIGREKCTGRC